MTEKEIKDLAREYAEQNPPQGIKDAILRENAISLNAQIFEKHLQWLSSRYCLVEKSKIHKWIDESELTAFDSIDLIEIFNDLFGKSLFTDTEQ